MEEDRDESGSMIPVNRCGERGTVTREDEWRAYLADQETQSRTVVMT